MAYTGNKLIHLQDDMIEQMENDLVAKVTAAYTAANLDIGVYGVFSVDDLENKVESELCNKIAIGVGYMGAEPTALDSNPKAPLNVSRGVAAKTLDFMFLVILAVPTGPMCDERFDATKLLTMQRKRIMGSDVAGDVADRTWAFVKEGPEVSASSDTMLYYSQVWRVALPFIGNSTQP